MKKLILTIGMLIPIIGFSQTYKVEEKPTWQAQNYTDYSTESEVDSTQIKAQIKAKKDSIETAKKTAVAPPSIHNRTTLKKSPVKARELEVKDGATTTKTDTVYLESKVVTVKTDTVWLEKKADTSAYKPLNLSKNKKHRLYENYEVQGGITKLGQQFKVGYSTNWENHYYSKYSIFYEMGNYKGIKVSNIGFDWGIYGNLFKVPKYVYLNLFGGATVNYLTIATEGYSNDFSRSINYGFIGGAELELYLKKNLILLGHANQKFLFNAKQGNWMYYYGVGIKYTYLH